MTMNKISNEQALSFIDSFLGKVEWKKSEESPITVKSSDVGGANLAGTEKAKVAGKEDTSPGNILKEEKAKEGAHGKEKSSDLAAAVPGTSVENAKAENNESKDKEHASTGDFGAEPTDDKGQDLAAEVQNKLKVASEQPAAKPVEQPKVQTKTAEEAKSMEKEARRAEALGNKILEKVSQIQEAQTIQKQAAETQNLLKTAAEEAYHDFVLSYQYGLLKRAEDEASIQDALHITAEEASALLDEIAAENPEAVMPAEAMPEEIPAEVPAEETAEAEGAPAAEGAAEEAAAEGEPGNEAEELIEALIQSGVPPEEIEAAIQEAVAEEGAAPAAEAAPEAAAEIPAEAPPAEGMPVMAEEDKSKVPAAVGGAAGAVGGGIAGVKAGKAVHNKALHHFFDAEHVNTKSGKAIRNIAGKVMEHPKATKAGLATAGAAALGTGIGALAHKLTPKKETPAAEAPVEEKAASEQEFMAAVKEAMPKTAEERKPVLVDIIRNFRATQSK